MTVPRPTAKPSSGCFSSGPCKKRPGYVIEEALRDAPLGRSHRSALGKAKLQKAIEDTRRILKIPADYLIGIVPASDTGAVEMVLWNIIGERNVDVCYWETFGQGWWSDISSALSLKGISKELSAGYGQLPDLSQTNPEHDIVFTWNGTTSGVKVPDGDWISDNRTGLTICDATSAVFAMDVPWSKIDVLTYSWQKVLGGEAAHGMLIMSPRAVERFESYTPPNRPIPKIFNIKKKGKVDRTIFEGNVINTVSMMCVEDYLDALAWVDSIGGLDETIRRSETNLQVLEDFVAKNSWIHFLAADKKIRSNTSVCLTLDLTADQVKKIVSMLDKEGVAYDIGAYRDAPPGLRIWCGATVEKEDVQILTQWIEWAYHTVKNA